MKCEVCGNENYLSFEVVAVENRHVFDGFSRRASPQRAAARMAKKELSGGGGPSILAVRRTRRCTSPAVHGELLGRWFIERRRPGELDRAAEGA